MPDPVRVRVSVPGRVAVNTYVHTQNTPSATWTIEHNIGRYPQVSSFDIDEDQIIGRVDHNSTTEVVIYFNSAVAGKAYLT
jgi:hypothetical protein